MIIKKFVGKTEEEATQQAKDELGESIVIMNVKLIRKGGFFSFLSKPKTEVTVAKEEEDVMKSITNKKNSHPEEKIIEKEDFSSVKVSGPHISSIDIKVGEESDEEISRRKAEEEKEIRERRAKEKEKALKEVSLRAKEKEISGNSDAGKKLAQASKEGIIPPLKVGKAKMSESRQATMEIPDKDPYFNNLSINDIVNSEKNMVNADKDQAKIIEEKLDSLHHLLEKSMGESGKTTEKKEEKTFNTITESDNESVNEDDETKSFVKVLRNTLIENEVDEKNADELIKDVERIAKPDMPMEYLLANVYQKMVLRFGDSVKIVPAENTAKGLIFVGPTGVGKTTTIAKLASFFSVTQHKKVALLTVDTYRVAAAEQLRTYASILEIPFRVIYSVEELEQAIKDYIDVDYIMVDTAGHSIKNEEQKEDVENYVKCLEQNIDTDVFLVMSATTKYRDLIGIADAYKNAFEYKLIFTKMDETGSAGNLYNLRIYTEKPMSYITDGQNVPDDIAIFDAQKVVKSLLGGGSETEEEES